MASLYHAVVVVNKQAICQISTKVKIQGKGYYEISLVVVQHNGFRCDFACRV
jgi:hypothetical protein